MRGQSATWTDRRIRPAVYERNITVGQFVPLDVCYAFLARRSTSWRHCHYFAHIRISTSTGSANSHLLAMLRLHLQNASTGSEAASLIYRESTRAASSIVECEFASEHLRSQNFQAHTKRMSLYVYDLEMEQLFYYA